MFRLLAIVDESKDDAIDASPITSDGQSTSRRGVCCCVDAPVVAIAIAIANSQSSHCIDVMI
jgi:hypothetical protein